MSESWDDLADQIAYAIHEEVCTAYRHEGRNAYCHRSARAAVGVLRKRAVDGLREALGVPSLLSKDSGTD